MAKETQKKLLNAALDVFADQGYRAATIQQIADRAGTNIAAINYHFRDKANFYAEVVVYGLEKRHNQQPDFLAVSKDPAEQLQVFVRWFLQVTLGFGRESVIDQIHIQEMLQPSPVLDKVVEKLIRPTHMKLRSIVTTLLPNNANEDMIRHHCFSIIGQCNLYRLGKPVITRLYPDMELNEHKVDALAKHITMVSLAGIRAEHV